MPSGTINLNSTSSLVYMFSYTFLSKKKTGFHNTDYLIGNKTFPHQHIYIIASQMADGIIYELSLPHPLKGFHSQYITDTSYD